MKYNVPGLVKAVETPDGVLDFMIWYELLLGKIIPSMSESELKDKKSLEVYKNVCDSLYEECKKYMHIIESMSPYTSDRVEEIYNEAI